ncbi:Basic-leucine zipper domain [Macleaya cordata]|uniref:Basic-leucine zipper domain n=1 Tax=Macleaya cordata TaxID=56857 RepID=A0A200PSH2_MACCD|nr:Basic-leucine zipper domain [Macleaya cordata]
MWLSEEMFGIPYPVFEGGFTPWENQEPICISLPQNPVQSNSSSDDPNRAVSEADERKKRRMISNRESARRSRMRKQKHLEDLRSQLNRLKTDNREMANRLSLVVQNCQLVRRDNDKLRFESEILRRRLSDIRRILILRKLQQLSTNKPY